MKRSRATDGVTIAELLVGFAVFAILMSILAFALERSSAIWNRTTSSSDSQNELRKAFASLHSDMVRTEFQTVQVVDGPTSLVGKDGDAVWFLSSVDPVTNEPMKTEDGRPFWQRNILYYTVVPDQHVTLFGAACVGGTDGEGYEVQCPHKFLMRKVIDNPTGAGPGDGTTPEQLLTDVSPYLTRPQGYDPNADSEPGLEDAGIEARNLVSFRAAVAPNPDWPGEIAVELTAARTDEARRLVKIGSASLEPFYNRFSFSLFPPVDPKS